jgi:YD repeat-containing protein
VQVVRLNSAAVSQTTLYTYDLVGNLLTVTQPDDETTSYTYDDDNRLTEELVTHPVTDSSTNTVITEPVFEEDYRLDDNGDGLRKSVNETHYNTDGSIFDTTADLWTYDADGRLTSEQMVIVYQGGAYNGFTPIGNAPAPYYEGFTYDLVGNRKQETISNLPPSNDPNSGYISQATLNYTYNGDDQRVTETRTGSTPYAITNQYDANGSLLTSTKTGTDGQVDTYQYDLRNRMTQETVTQGGVITSTTTFGYDTDGDRVSESTTPALGPTQSTYYLNDPENPTGYTKPVQESSTLAGTPDRSYVLGLRVQGQSTTTASDTQDVEYLLIDGHGSTRALVDLSGNVTASYDCDAFGNALDFDPTTAATPWLFGGDGLYDASTGWTYHLARWTDGDVFTSLDSITENPGDLANANLYLLDGGNPISNIDPSGHDFADVLATVEIISTLVAESLPTVASAVGYTALTFLGLSAAASPFAYLEQERYLDTGTFFRDLQNASWTRFQLSSFLYVLSADVANSAGSPQPPANAGQIPTVTANADGHADAVDDFVAQAEANGYRVVGTEVTVKTPFGERRVDVVIQDTAGTNHGVEIKTSAGAFDRNDADARQQFAADRWINTQGDGVRGIGQNSGLLISTTSKILWRLR